MKCVIKNQFLQNLKISLKIHWFNLWNLFLKIVGINFKIKIQSSKIHDSEAEEFNA